MTPYKRERYVRWQNYRITQFSFAINLFLTFGVAALGFSCSLLKEASLPPPGEGWLLRYAIYGFAVSVVCGTLATLSRLFDFRYTALKILKKHSGWRQTTAKFFAAHLGKVSWCMFFLQLAALAYGAFRLLSLILSAYAAKLMQ
jgi:hypothetical protein